MRSTRCERRSRTSAPTAGTSSRRRTRRSRSTWRRSCTSASPPKPAASVSSGRVLRALDLALLRQLRTRGHGTRLETAMKWLSRAGEHGIVWDAIALLGAVLDAPRRHVYLRALRVVAAA